MCNACPRHDLVILRRGDPLMFREVELHGRGTTWLDRYDLLQPKHLDATADLALPKARLPALRSAFDMFQHIPTKERLRGRAVDALRIRHCPHLRNFGLRYLDRDQADLERKHAQAQAWFWQTMKELESASLGH